MNSLLSPLCRRAAWLLAASALTTFARAQTPAAVTTYGALASALSSSTPTIQIATPITLAGNLNIPSTSCLRFDAAGELTGAFTVTFHGCNPTASANRRIFAPAVSVSGLTGNVPPQWFGATADGTQGVTAGTDNTTAMQKTLKAIRSGCMYLAPGVYDIAHALTITSSSVGVCGVNGGLNGGNSLIQSTSPTADVLDVGNGPTGRTIQWNQFHNFAIGRAVVPSGPTVTALKLDNVGGYDIGYVALMDSTRMLYFHMAPNYSIGATHDVNMSLGSVAITGSYSSQKIYCAYFDSADGKPEDSVVLNNVNCGRGGGANAGSAITYGYYISGSAIQDVDLNNVATANIQRAFSAIYTGGGSHDTSADIHVNNPTFDNCATCIYASGLNDSTGDTLTVNNGYLLAAGESACGDSADLVVSIANSSGVSLTHNQIWSNFPSNLLKAINSTRLDIEGNQFGPDTCAAYAISFSGVTASTIEHNTFNGGTPRGAGFTSVITLNSSSTGNHLSGNILTGRATTGEAFDNSSLANESLDTIDPTNIHSPFQGIPVGTTPQHLGPASTVGGLPVYQCPVAGSLAGVILLPGAGAGASSAVIKGIPATNCNFGYHITTGSSPATGSEIAKFHFTSKFPISPTCAAFPRSGTAAGVPVFLDATPTDALLQLGTTASLTASTTYAWIIWCNPN